MALEHGVRAIASILVLASFGLFGAQSGGLRKVGEIDLTKALDLKGETPAVPVFALRFSPDGRKLAVIAGAYQRGGDRKSHLLVIDIDHPATRARQVEVDFGILENENGRGGALNFGWTPSGQTIYAVGTVFHLVSGTTCSLPNQSIFVSDGTAISVRPEPLQPLTRIVFYNDKCEEQDRWEVAESWLVSDVSLDRHLISVLGVIASNVTSERLIADPIGRKIVQRWPETGGGAWEFADSGKVVCKGGPVLESEHASAVCRDVDTGREIGNTVKNGVEPIATAARATRVVVSDYRRRKIPFAGEYDATFKGRFVWDFGTGRELVSWRPESETYKNIFKPTQQITEPFRFAMSPDGQFVAEGGNGIIRLYKIEP